MAFRSAMVAQFADQWGIALRFQAAYALGGNGIVEESSDNQEDCGKGKNYS